MGLRGKFLGWLSGSGRDEDEERERLDAAHARLNQRAIDAGLWDEEEIDRSAENWRRDAASYEETADIGEEFEVDALAGNLNDSLNKVGFSTLSTVWKAVPIWVWAGLALYLAWQLGLLKGLLKRA